MNKSTTVTAMIECPKGSNQKFDYDLSEKRYRLSKFLPAEMVFPFDFGMIPGTKGEDGDPLDIIVISEGSTFPGCLVDCRVIGALQAEQTERNGETMRNDRFIATARKMKGVCQPKTIRGLSDDILDQIERFFVSYNAIEGKKFKMLRLSDETVARKLIEKAHKKFLAEGSA